MLFQAFPGVHVRDGDTVRSDGGHGGEFKDRVCGTLKLFNVILNSVAMREDHPGGDFLGVRPTTVHGLREYEGEMVAEALVNVLETIVDVSLLKGVIDFVDKSRDGRRRLGLRREAVGDRVSGYAFNKARRLLPRTRGRRKRGRGGLQVGTSNHLEKRVPRSPRELLRDPFVVGNGVFDNLGSRRGGCLFGLPGLRC
jgi:hypothetical protein